MPTSDTLDYYHLWLGIPPDEQPPSHYRLLGLRLFEPDPTVISNAADRQMAHVKRNQSGPHRAITQKLLNELSAARSCLQNSESKQEYDRQIRKSMFPPEAPPAQRQIPVAVVPTPPAGSPVTTIPTLSTGRVKPLQRKKNDSTLVLGLTVAAMIVVGILVVASQDRTTEVGPHTRPLSPAPTKPGPSPIKSPQSTSFVEVVGRVEPAVVRIDTNNRDYGSGVIVDDRGLILTNYHVIAGAARATITLHSGSKLDVLGYCAVDPERDLLLLNAKPFVKSRAIKIAPAQPDKGESVLAFGAPVGLSFSPSDGMVSAIRTGIEVSAMLDSLTYQRLGYTLDAHWIQHTAPISRGNSGGPLFNMRGELIGLNTWTRTDGQNLNFAIAVSDIKQFLDNPDRQFSANLFNLPNPRKESQGTKTPEAPLAPVPKPDNKPAEQPEADEEPSRDASPVRVTSLNDPFPSGKIYSPGIFDIEFGKALDEKDKGLVVFKHPNGKVFALASQRGGKLHGLTVARYDNGNPMVYVNYFQGKRHGLLEAWNDDGTPVVFSQYTMGKLDGFTCFFDDGQLRLLIEYRFDKPKWIRLISGEQVVKEFPARDDPELELEEIELFEKFDAADRTMDGNEADFRKRVFKSEEERRNQLRIDLAPTKKKMLQEYHAQRDAADEAARQQFAKEAQELFTPGRPFTIPVRVK